MSDLIGDKALIRRLKHVTRGAERAIRRQGLNAASKVVERRAKQLVPVDRGNLKKSFGHVVRAGRSRDSVYAVIGPKAGKGEGVTPVSGKKINPARYGHLPEEGFNHPGAGHVAGQFFLKRALEESAPEVISVMTRKVREAMNKRGV